MLQFTYDSWLWIPFETQMWMSRSDRFYNFVNDWMTKRRVFKLLVWLTCVFIDRDIILRQKFITLTWGCRITWQSTFVFKLSSDNTFLCLWSLINHWSKLIAIILFFSTKRAFFWMLVMKTLSFSPLSVSWVLILRIILTVSFTNKLKYLTWFKIHWI